MLWNMILSAMVPTWPAIANRLMPNIHDFELSLDIINVHFRLHSKLYRILLWEWEKGGGDVGEGPGKSQLLLDWSYFDSETHVRARSPITIAYS